VIGGCSVFPTSNVWNTPVDRLPTVADPEASNYLATIGLGTGLHPDFGSGTWDGGNIGIPYDVVPQVQAFVPVDFALLGWDDESDAGPYLIPLDPQIEGEPANAVGDRHVLVVHQEDCDLYEVYYAYPDGVDAAAVNDSYPDVLTCAAGTNGWCGASGAVFDLSSNAFRTDGWTSADAAGLPILPGLARHEEVAAGEIRHALRFTAAQTRNAHWWPARHHASSSSTASRPPMGLRVRLKADVDLSSFGPQSRVILAALKKYGMILADNGSNWYVSGAPHASWDNDDLHDLGDVTGSDFEVVDQSSLIVDPDSGETPHLWSDGFERGGAALGFWSAVAP